MRGKKITCGNVCLYSRILPNYGYFNFCSGDFKSSKENSNYKAEFSFSNFKFFFKCKSIFLKQMKNVESTF